MRKGWLALLVSILSLAVSASLWAQTSRPTPKAPPVVEPLKGDWSEIDQRMVFLTIQLASVEASMDAVNKQLRVAGYQQGAKQNEADLHRKGSELMDRNMGMPASIRWNEFYGKTADKFFYHPVDRSSSYHTVTVLRQQKPGDDQATGEGVPSRQGLPLPQRPPQIDYIYKANAEAQKRSEAEVAKLAGKKDALLARRRQIEAEQSALWCKIAFRAIAGRELANKPLYRFNFKVTDQSQAAAEQLMAMKATTAETAKPSAN